MKAHIRKENDCMLILRDDFVLAELDSESKGIALSLHWSTDIPEDHEFLCLISNALAVGNLDVSARFTLKNILGTAIELSKCHEGVSGAATKIDKDSRPLFERMRQDLAEMIRVIDDLEFSE
jgi:hypothetical protein